MVCRFTAQASLKQPPARWLAQVWGQDEGGVEIDDTVLDMQGEETVGEVGYAYGWDPEVMKAHRLRA